VFSGEQGNEADLKIGSWSLYTRKQLIHFKLQPAAIDNTVFIGMHIALFVLYKNVCISGFAPAIMADIR